MFNISNKSLTYLFVNTSCMIANAYLAPKTFTISFAIGAALGLGMGLKHRIDILLIDHNEKAVKAVTNQSAQMADKANQMTASLQAQAKDGIKKAGDTTIGKTAVAVHYANK